MLVKGIMIYFIPNQIISYTFWHFLISKPGCSVPPLAHFLEFSTKRPSQGFSYKSLSLSKRNSARRGQGGYFYRKSLQKKDNALKSLAGFFLLLKPFVNKTKQICPVTLLKLTTPKSDMFFEWSLKIPFLQRNVFLFTLNLKKL